MTDQKDSSHTIYFTTNTNTTKNSSFTIYHLAHLEAAAGAEFPGVGT